MELQGQCANASEDKNSDDYEMFNNLLESRLQQFAL